MTANSHESKVITMTGPEKGEIEATLLTHDQRCNQRDFPKECVWYETARINLRNGYATLHVAHCQVCGTAMWWPTIP